MTHCLMTRKNSLHRPFSHCKPVYLLVQLHLWLSARSLHESPFRQRLCTQWLTSEKEIRFSNVILKDDFQSLLRTLESLFAVFVLFHVRYHDYLHEGNSKFQTNHHYRCEAVEA